LDVVAETDVLVFGEFFGGGADFGFDRFGLFDFDGTGIVDDVGVVIALFWEILFEDWVIADG
jgi:hypothetical protein